MMTSKLGQSGAAALSLVFVASCGPQTDRADLSTNEKGPEQTTKVAAPTGEAEEGEQTRSILRPDISTPTPEPSPIEPLHAVISFGASPFALDEAGRAAVDALFDEPAMKSGGAIVLRGHSDSRGSDGDNLAASRARAERVRDYLVEQGISPERITVIALGETRPVAPNATSDGADDPEGRARNRRVEINVAAATTGNESADPGGVN